LPRVEALCAVPDATFKLAVGEGAFVSIDTYSIY